MASLVKIINYVSVIKTDEYTMGYYIVKLFYNPVKL